MDQDKVRSIWINWMSVLLALLVLSTAYFSNLGTAPLWGDEAGTGIFARNILNFGYPTAFDGRNLSFYDGGAELNSDLVVAKIPWVQFYLGALSIKLFGNDALGLRFLFALSGLAALFPMWAVLRTRVRMPLFMSTLTLVAPQVAMFHRNARYYPVLTLLFATQVWIVCNRDLSSRKRLWFTSASMCLMFHTHPIAAAACASALIVHGYFSKSHTATYFAASAAGFLSWLIWSWNVGPTITAPSIFADYRGQNPADWIVIMGRNVWASIADMDAVQGLPLLAWSLGLTLLLRGHPKVRVDFFRDPLVSFVMTTLVIQVVVVAALIGTETADEHSLLRYMPHLLAFGIATLFVLIDKVFKDKYWIASICTLVLATNFLSLSFWNAKATRNIPWSWWPATYGEVFQPQPEAIAVAMNVIRRQNADAKQVDKTVLMVPDWLQEIAIFNLGDELVITQSIPPGSATESIVRSKIGQEALMRFRSSPSWVIHAATDAPISVPDYERIQIRTHRLRPDDGTRPELTRHTFNISGQDRSISLYKRLKQ